MLNFDYREQSTTINALNVAEVFIKDKATFVNLHCHCVVLEGVSLDRTEAGLTPRFVTGEPPTDAVLPQSS